MVPIITPFAKLANAIFPIDDNGILVLRDYAENVKRMLEMIEQIDVSVPAEYISEVIPIRYAKVDDIASALNSLGGSGGATREHRRPPPARRRSAASRRRHAHRHGRHGRWRGRGHGRAASIPVASTRVGGSQFGQRPQGNGRPRPTARRRRAPRFQQRLQRHHQQRLRRRGGQQDQIQVFGQTKIIADESSNSLLIFATRQDMEAIKDIIAKLDVLLAQVLIEAVIMDVSLGNQFQFGVSAAQNPKTFSPSIPASSAAAA